jgi:hypothetical protein
MNTSLKKPTLVFNLGDQVIWSNPELEWDDSTYRIVDILTVTGSVTDVDTLLVIESEYGRTSEVFVSEVH